MPNKNTLTMKMTLRGILGMTTAAAVLLSAAGCVKFDRPAGTPGSGADSCAITFPTPLVSSVTKASDGRSDYPEDSSFGVYGLYCPGGDFAGWESTPGAALYIDGAEFSYSAAIDDSTEGSGAWISSPAYYWLPEGKMTFAAWSPFSAAEAHSESLTYGASGLTVTGFDTNGGSRDLMYSERVYDKSSSTGTSTSHDGIDLVFHHALSALSFKARPADGIGAKVEITKIVAWGFCRKGTFRENITENTASQDEETPTWNRYASAPGWTLESDNTYTEDNPLVLTEENPTIFVLPQPVGDDVKIKVYYTVQIGTGAPVPAVSQEVSLSGKTVSGTEDILAEWKMATRYNYTLVLGATMIRFSVDVDTWGGNEFDIND